MSEHYQLIWDPTQIQRFQDLFCTGLDNYFIKYMFLAARRKYDSKQKRDGTTCFNRQIISRQTRSLQNLVQRYEVPVGTYTSSDDNPISQDALVVYFLLNPRNIVKGYNKFSKKVSDQLCESIFTLREVPFYKMISEFKSCIHSTSGEKAYVELDVDTKNPHIIQKILDVVYPLQNYIVCTIETNGGYHIIFDNNSLTKDEKSVLWKTFNTSEYKFESTDFNGKSITKSYVDIRSDPSPPIPGTLQGGFAVNFIELEDIDPRRGKWVYCKIVGDWDSKEGYVGDEIWQDFPVEVSEEIKCESRYGISCEMTVTHEDVKYEYDFTCRMAKINGEKVIPKYIKE